MNFRLLVEPVRGDNGEFQTGKKVEDPIEPPMTMEAERYIGLENF